MYVVRHLCGITTRRRSGSRVPCWAVAARAGTRFLVTAESGAYPDYVAALLSATANDTVHTAVFGEGWLDAPHRVLRLAKEKAATWAERVAGPVRVRGPALGSRPLVPTATNGVYHWRGDCDGDVRRLRCR
jgi:hypothetical protein